MTSTSLKIISLNIEQDKHFNRITPFIKLHKPDIILLQEVLDKDIPYLENIFGMKSNFAPLNILLRETESQLGLLTLSNLTPIKSYNSYYRGNQKNLPRIHDGEPEKMARAILITEYLNNNQHFCLVNTHFTWSANGQPNTMQYGDLKFLLDLLGNIPEFILCGDFNAPRGRVIFDTIASIYKDNIPSELTTSIDKNLHKAGNLNLMVDGLFTTPSYLVDSVKLYEGVSDHLAIVANCKKIDNYK